MVDGIVQRDALGLVSALLSFSSPLVAYPRRWASLGLCLVSPTVTPGSALSNTQYSPPPSNKFQLQIVYCLCASLVSPPSAPLLSSSILFVSFGHVAGGSVT
eukprot:scaffold7421_cov131-Isochrysis_galbana.AAC.3